jgi:EAL domain-containing protein (putative c-di-GMP-specific phosphodiesterase class I)
LAIRLKKFIKPNAVLARFGNDEFILCIPDLHIRSRIESMVHRLDSIIKKPVKMGKNKFHITASTGICVYPEHGDNPDLIMKNANTVLRHVKKEGENHYELYSADMDILSRAQLLLEHDLHQALQKNQLCMYYQPIYTLDKSRIVAVEALIRWRHPAFGMLLPATFIHSCEETNLIISVGAWMLRDVCQQMKMWHDLGFNDLVVTVNISTRQFNHSGFVDLIIDTLEKTKLPAHCLELEITETLLLQNTDAVISRIQLLRTLGVQFSLDDFGTGYSALSYLRQFPLSALKIDQSFISKIDSKTEGAIVGAIITLGKILGLSIIAEGVETEQQLAILKEKQCDYIQGYLFSHPLSGTELESLLLNRSGDKA